MSILPQPSNLTISSIAQIWLVIPAAMVGLSVCHDKMPPEIAAQYVLNNPDKRDRLLLNCELAGGDLYFTVPRVIMAMKMMGMKRAEIEKGTYENPKKFFKLPLD